MAKAKKPMGKRPNIWAQLIAREISRERFEEILDKSKRDAFLTGLLLGAEPGSPPSRVTWRGAIGDVTPAEWEALERKVRTPDPTQPRVSWVGALDQLPRLVMGLWPWHLDPAKWEALGRRLRAEKTYRGWRRHYHLTSLDQRILGALAEGNIALTSRTPWKTWEALAERVRSTPHAVRTRWRVIKPKARPLLESARSVAILLPTSRQNTPEQRQRTGKTTLPTKR